MAQLVRKAFLLARHAETTDNVEGKASGGGSDPNITTHGREQAAWLHEIIALRGSFPRSIVVTSRKRTHQTAHGAVGHDMFVEEKGLDERHLGILDGIISVAEQKIRGPLPGEQTKSAHREQVLDAMNRQLSVCDAQDTPLFVIHGGTARRIFESMGFPELHEVGNAVLYECVPVGKKDWKVFELSVSKDQYRQPVLKRKDITPQRGEQILLG